MSNIIKESEIQAEILHHLKQKEAEAPQLATEIAEAIEIDTLSVSLELSYLTKSGLLERKRHAGDGKYIYTIKPTNKKPATNLSNALKQLEQKLEPIPQQVNNINTKIMALTQLALILDESISDLLSDIINDLKTANRKPQ